MAPRREALGRGAQPAGSRVVRSPAGSPRIRARRWRELLVYASILGVLLGGLMVLLSLASVDATAKASLPSRPDGALAERRSLGSPEAPVVITEWIDFQCPACRAFALTREPEIERLYVNTGQVRLVVRNLGAPQE